MAVLGGGLFLMSKVPLYKGLASRILQVAMGAKLTPQRAYMGTSLIKNSAPLGPYSRPIPRDLCRSQGGGQFLMSEAPMQVYLAEKKTPPPQDHHRALGITVGS